MCRRCGARYALLGESANDKYIDVTLPLVVWARAHVHGSGFAERFGGSRIVDGHNIVWVVRDTATRRIEIRKAIAWPVRSNEVQSRPEGTTRHESI